MTFWRDVDCSRPQVGFRIWRSGGEISLGRRVYRWRRRGWW